MHGLELGDKKLIVQRAHTGMSKLPMIDGALPGAGLGRPILPIEILGASGLKPAEPTVVLLLLNLCDVEVLAGDEYEGIVEDVKAECERFGTVVDLHVPKPEFGKLVIGVGRVRLSWVSYIRLTSSLQTQKIAVKHRGHWLGESSWTVLYLRLSLMSTSMKPESWVNIPFDL